MTTTTTTEAKLLTAADLLRLYREGVRGELIRGVLWETMPTGQEHGEIAALVAAELVVFARARALGRVTTSDAGVRLERDPDTVREPDVAFFSAAKIPPGVRVTGYSEVVPDLVAEIPSPGDGRRALRERPTCGWAMACVSSGWCGRRSAPSTSIGPGRRWPRWGSRTTLTGWTCCRGSAVRWGRCSARRPRGSSGTE